METIYDDSFFLSFFSNSSSSGIIINAQARKSLPIKSLLHCYISSTPMAFQSNNSSWYECVDIL